MSRSRAEGAAVGALTLVLCFMVLVPVFTLLYASFREAPPGTPGHLTIANYVQVYTHAETFRLLPVTLGYAAGTGMVAVLLGTFFAWTVTRTNTPGRRVFAVMAFMPFLAPLLLMAVSWNYLLSPRIGLINTVLMSMLGLTQPPFDIGSLGGMVWTSGVSLSPLVYVTVAPALQSMDRSLEEVARLSGAGVLATIRRVTLPLAVPSILSAALLIFIIGLGSFDVPAFIGMPANIYVFTTRIYYALTVSSPPAYGLAGALSVLLLAGTLTAVFIYARVTRRADLFVTITGKGFRAGVVDLGRWRWLTFVMLLASVLVTAVLPLLVLVVASLVRYYTGFSTDLLTQLTFENYQTIFHRPIFWRAARNTLILAPSSAVLTVLLATVVGYVAIRTRLPGRRLLATIANLPLAFPGMVFALGLLWTYLRIPIGIYGSLWILLLAYVTIGIPVGLRVISGAIFQIHRELEEASTVSGATRGTTFARIVLPLLRPSMLSGGLFLFLVFSRELTASVLLYTYGSEVVSTTLWEFWQSGEWGLVAALAVLLMMTSLVVIVAAQRILRIHLSQ